MENLKSGDKIYMIYSYNNELGVQTADLKYISKKGRIICRLAPLQGLKKESLNNFNRYRSRGYLNTFKTFSSESCLKDNISMFIKKYKKVTGKTLTNL